MELSQHFTLLVDINIYMLSKKLLKILCCICILLIISIIYFYIKQTTPKHNGLKQRQHLFAHKSVCEGTWRKETLAPPHVSCACSKALHSGCQLFWPTEKKMQTLQGEITSFGGLYVFKKFKKYQYFLKTRNTKILEWRSRY